MNMLKGKAIQSMSRRGNCYDNAVIESLKPSHALNDLLRVAKMPRQAFTIKRLSETITKLKMLFYRRIKRTKTEMVIAP